MKLIRYGEPGKEKPGVVLDEKRYDVSEYFNDFDEAFFTNDGIRNLQKLVESKPSLKQFSNDIRLGSPIARPSKIVCIGLNYAKHAAESGAIVPAEPIIFMKSTTSLCGPNDQIILPKNSKKTDWEVELAFVIGKIAKYVDIDKAMDYVAGYCLHNDVSER